MLLYQETSPLFTQSVTHTAAPIHRRHEPFWRPQTGNSWLFLLLVARLWTTDADGELCVEVRRQQTHPSSETDTWALKMPCLLNRNLHGAAIERSFSFSGRNRMRPIGILWGERWRGDSWEGVFNYNRKRKLLPACITKCLRWAFSKTDVWNWAKGFLKLSIWDLSFLKCDDK